MREDVEETEEKVSQSNTACDKSENKVDHVCYKKSSLLKCWRCSMKSVMKILPQTRLESFSPTTDVPRVFLNSLKSLGCKNASDEPIKVKIPVVVLERLELSKIKTEPEEENQEMNLVEKMLPRKTFQCQICHKDLQSHRSLHNHTANAHFNVKRYFCDLCDGRYFFKKNLVDHMNNHIKIPNFKSSKSCHRKYKCTKCEKSFSTSSGRSAHKIVHAGKNGVFYFDP